MTKEQDDDVNQLLNSFTPFHIEDVEISERLGGEVLVSFKTDDGPRGKKSSYFLGHWDGVEYHWAFYLEDMPLS